MRIEQLADVSEVLLARDAAGVPRGFLTIHRKTGAIDQLAVDPACGGRGLGRRLLEQAKRLSPAGLRLRVLQVNGRAVSFYKAAGFTVAGEALSARAGLPLFVMAWLGGLP